MHASRLNLVSLALALLLGLGNLPAFGQRLGDPCTPGDPAFRPGISCQATDEFSYYEPYILNAKKGDALVSAGCGLIGGLLRALPTRQQFNHAGIMVEDRVRLRNSTAAEGRYPIGAGGDGFVPETLQYGFPGTVTQSVFEAFEGQFVIDPDDNNQAWRLRTFNRDPVQCEGDPTATFPSVIKPPFDMEDSLLASGEPVRSALNRAADEALGIEGHYRPYGYTDANLLGRTQGPGSRLDLSSVWAFAENKLDGTMCSSFVWSALRGAGLPLEGPAVEAGDKPHAALDGLYDYSEEERLAAASWMYDQAYNAFYDVAGWWGRLFTDAPDDAGNQVVNCFAFDWCGEQEGFEWDGDSNPKDSERWRQPGRGTTVSPEDMTHWDLPIEGGVYGLTEPLRYRMGGYRPTHRWGASAGTGQVEVTVIFRTATINGVPVTLDGFDPQLTSAQPRNGTTLFQAVPAGRYWVEAITDLNDNGTIREARAGTFVNVRSGVTERVNLNLQTAPQQPSNTTESHRRITISGSVFVRDSDWPSGDETNLCNLTLSHVIDPVIQPEVALPFNCCADEARGEGTVRVRLNPGDLSVTTSISATLFEAGGGSCGGNDNDAQGSAAAVIPKDASATITGFATNGDWDSDDAVRVQVHVRNERNTVP